MALFGEDSGSQTSGDQHAWSTHPTGWKRTFSPTNQSVYLLPQGQSEDFWNIHSPQVSNGAFSTGQEGKGPAFLITGALPLVTVKRNIIPFTHLQKRKFRHVECKEPGQAQPGKTAPRTQTRRVRPMSTNVPRPQLVPSPPLRRAPPGGRTLLQAWPLPSLPPKHIYIPFNTLAISIFL